MSLPIRNEPVTIGDQLIRRHAAVNRRIASVADRLFQLAYAVAYRMLRVWWFVRRPKHRGALVALWHDGELLMVRSSYRPRWDLPGGGVRRGENVRDAAVREMREEVGLAIDVADLHPALSGEAFWEHRHDLVTIFEVALWERPTPRVDNREIIEARFRAPATVGDEEVAPHIARYLARFRAPGSGDATALSPPRASSPAAASARRSAAPI
jgi:8-oxo-dGTP diphosphatase